MSNNEFSNEFDILLNSYRDIKQFGITNSNISFEVNEYEKSVLLTHAQRDLVIDLYKGTYNGYSYEHTEDIRRYLSTLNDTKELNSINTSIISISDNPVFYQLPDNSLYITIEQVKIMSDNPCDNGNYINIKPIRRDEYNKFKRNPHRRPNKDFAYRIDHQNNIVEIIYEKPVSTYKVGLLVKPTPIILEDLNYLTIDGISTETECALPEVLHKEILKRAVMLYVMTLPQVNNNNN